MSSHKQNENDHSNEHWSSSLNYVMNITIENVTININEGGILNGQSGSPVPNQPPPTPPPSGG